MLNRVKNSITLKNIMVVFMGSMIAQVVNVLFQPIITRVYTPEVIGIYGLFGSIGVMLSELSSLSYPFAIVLPKKDSEAKKIVQLSILLAFLSSAVLLFLTPFRTYITDLFNISELNAYFPLMSLYLLFWNIRNINIQWSVRNEYFKLQSYALLVFVLFTNLTKVIIGYFYPYSVVMIVLNILGFGAQGIFLYLTFRNKPIGLNDLKHNNLEMLTKVGKEYSDFPLYRAPQNFIAEFSNNLPILLLSALFGPAYVGFYTMSKKILNIPAQLITKSVGDVLYPQLSKQYRNGKSITPTLVKSILTLSIIGIIPFGLVILIGPTLFDLVLGDGWHHSGVYARWISIYLFFAFINRPATKAAIVLRLQKFILIYQVVLSLAKSAALLLGFYIFNDDVASILLYSITGAIMNLFLILYVIYYSKKIDKINKNRRLL